MKFISFCTCYLAKSNKQGFSGQTTWHWGHSSSEKVAFPQLTNCVQWSYALWQQIHVCCLIVCSNKKLWSPQAPTEFNWPAQLNCTRILLHIINGSCVLAWVAQNQIFKVQQKLSQESRRVNLTSRTRFQKPPVNAELLEFVIKRRSAKH